MPTWSAPQRRHVLPTVLPIVLVLGAPGTGAETLVTALQARIAPGSARVVLGSARCTDLENTLRAALPPRDAVTAGVLVLLMGLDPLLHPTRRAEQEACDASLRGALADAGVPFRVVYGHGEPRITNALRALHHIAPAALPTGVEDGFDANSTSRQARLRNWNCEKCSDPECEHRLFTSLTGGRSRPA